MKKRYKVSNSFTIFSRMMPVWVVLLGIIGFFYPKILAPLKSSLDCIFFFTMLGIGTTLNFYEFKPIIKKPTMVLLGVLTQFSLMPLLGFIIGEALHLNNNLKLGLIIVGSVPGAMASNIIAYLAKTDKDLTVTAFKRFTLSV